MKILLIHQYFLGKNQGGGSRFNEMAKTWSDEGHEITVISRLVLLSQGKKIQNMKVSMSIMRRITIKISMFFAAMFPMLIT